MSPTRHRRARSAPGSYWPRVAASGYATAATPTPAHPHAPLAHSRRGEVPQRSGQEAQVEGCKPLASAESGSSGRIVARGESVVMRGCDARYVNVPLKLYPRPEPVRPHSPWSHDSLPAKNPVDLKVLANSKQHHPFGFPSLCRTGRLAAPRKSREASNSICPPAREPAGFQGASAPRREAGGSVNIVSIRKSWGETPGIR